MTFTFKFEFLSKEIFYGDVEDDTKKVAAGLKKYKNKKVTLLVKQKNSNILEDDTNKVAKGLKKYKDEEVTLLVNDNTLTM